MQRIRFFSLCLGVFALFLIPTTAEASCEASQECGGGFVVYCVSPNDYSCFTGWNYVQCDGERTYCPRRLPNSEISTVEPLPLEVEPASPACDLPPLKAEETEAP